MKLAAKIFKRGDRLWLHSVISFLTILLLAFIDNGAAVFAQLKYPVVWLFLLIDSVIVLFGQAIVREWILFWYKDEESKTFLAILLGIPLGLFFLFSLFYLLKHA